MPPLRIVIIGAGSASFGLNALATLLREPSLRGSHLALVDNNATGLRLIHQLGDRMNVLWDAGLTISSHTDRRQALTNADFVVCAIEVGPREELWEKDWQLTLRHGLRQPYAENGGPGGFAHAARNIPHILDIARDMEDLCPQALFINLSNPLPRLCRAISRYTSIRVVGLCHQIGFGYGLVGILLADYLGVSAPGVLLTHARRRRSPEDWQVIDDFRVSVEDRVQIVAGGLNHFSWMLEVRDRQTGADLYPLLRDRFLAQAREPLTRDLLRLTGQIAATGDTHLCEYLPYLHNAETSPWQHYDIHLYDWAGAAQGRDTLWEHIARLTTANADDLQPLRTLHSEGVYEVIHGVGHGGAVYRDAIDAPNRGSIPGLPFDTIVEAPATLTRSGAHLVGLPALPPLVTEWCRREAELVELVVEAAATGSRAAALQALALDPTIDDLRRAEAILDDILATHQANLPQFHGAWRWRG